jgi:hypothetical protein
MGYYLSARSIFFSIWNLFQSLSNLASAEVLKAPENELKCASGD